MKILSIDCSAVSASVAILDDNKILSSSYSNVGLTHSQTLMPMLDSTLKNARIELSDIDYFAINVGPGSFTGIRIGVAALKGLTEFDEANCFAVSTLESIAYNLKGIFNGVVVSAMDARCGQVYTATFEITGDVVTRLTEDDAVLIEDLAENLKGIKKDIIFVGDGATLCYNILKEKVECISLAPEHLLYQNAVGVARVARDQIAQGKAPIKSEDIMPFYLRVPQAERELKKRQENEQ
ncbi:MAG: tRNA (adenosine(37)-N6)-threonylcarbamoyltransferase complex dimerization subunit type 1 TsaB [Ruminococcaceae bacterium]|nr:tRNA (adenosine(37)-N6)-threonylcarbamoyltransferase complex dimerization subunit type 1 TsaB [Oscillospiraceae bacterium]